MKAFWVRSSGLGVATLLFAGYGILSGLPDLGCYIKMKFME
jgi:hypothetical protein